MATVIQDILNNGRAINDELGKKIGLLAERNSRFKDTFTRKLTDINTAIERFKSTNLQGLTETKERLTNVTNELNATKETLTRTQSELEQIRGALSASQSELQNVTSVKNGLEQKERDLNDRIRQLEAEYQNNINNVREEMKQQTNAEKAAMKQEFDNQMASLNNEKAELQKGIQDAQQNQQSSLVNNLGEINSLLTRQLELISNINTEQPNDAEYSQLLDVIQTNLGGVISEINQAVSGQPRNQNQNRNQTLYDIEANFNNLMNLYKRQDKRQYQASLRNIDGGVQDQINRNIVNADRGDRDAINAIKSILRDNQTIINNSSLFGGRRRSKTMRKKQRKTRKSKSRKQRGGYVYSSSRELDKASSIVSASSGSKTRSKSKNKSRNKSKNRTATTTASSTNTTSSPNSNTHTTSSPI